MKIHGLPVFLEADALTLTVKCRECGRTEAVAATELGIAPVTESSDYWYPCMSEHVERMTGYRLSGNAMFPIGPKRGTWGYRVTPEEPGAAREWSVGFVCPTCRE